MPPDHCGQWHIQQLHQGPWSPETNKKSLLQHSDSPNIKNIVPREKFLDNKSSKVRLVLLLAQTFRRNGISVQQCPDNADTSIIWASLDEASPVEVRAEDTDIMVMLIQHTADYQIFLTTAKETSYNVGKIQEALPERYRKNLIILHSFSGCDTVSVISGFRKSTLLTKLCKTDKAERTMDMFLDIQGKKDTIIKASCEIFKLIFPGKPPKDLGDLRRFDTFSKRAAAGSIKPEKLSSTTGAAGQFSLRAYLQARDWLVLQSPSLDVLDYGWNLSDQGYEQVLSTDLTPPDHHLKLSAATTQVLLQNK